MENINLPHTPKVDETKEKSRIRKVDALKDFLEVKIPSRIFEGITHMELLENSQVRQILAESDPQLYIDKAAYVTIDQDKVVAAMMHVTPEMCRGHFDWYPMMPLALMAQCAGQAGAILVNLITGYKKGIPLAVHVRDTRSISDKTSSHRKDFIVPGDSLLFVAVYKGGKFGLHRATVQVYNEGLIMGALDEINYIVVDKDYFNKPK